MRLPCGVPVVGIGSAVLGGAGKTPVTIAWAKRLAEGARRVAVVAHAYRASPGAARRVLAQDGVREVGDDALVLAAALAPEGIDVFVAPTRQAALDLAADRADVVVIDGLLQAAPERLGLSVLVLDGRLPWGSGRSLPAGDLRADREAVLRACDQVVVVDDPLQPAMAAPFPSAIRAVLHFEGFLVRGRSLPIAAGQEARLGLLLLVARPQRIAASLQARGIRPLCQWWGGDHATPGPRDVRDLEALARRHRLDGWLVTPKCATHLSSGVGAPLWVMETTVRLDPQPPTVVDSRPCARHTFSMHC